MSSEIATLADISSIKKEESSPPYVYRAPNPASSIWGLTIGEPLGRPIVRNGHTSDRSFPEYKITDIVRILGLSVKMTEAWIQKTNFENEYVTESE